MTRSKQRGAIAAATPVHRHPLLAAFNLFLAAPFFSTLRCPSLRRWSLRTLTLVALLMALSEAQDLSDRFQAARRQVNAWRLFRRVIGATYQGFVKAIARVSPRLLPAIAEHLRQQAPAVAGTHWKLGCWVPIGADGSRFNLPRTAANLEAFGTAGKKRSGPQAYVTALLHLPTGLPWAVRLGRADADERGHLRRMLRHLPPETLLVVDAGFVGYPLWSQLQRRKLHFLVRVGGNVRLLKRLGYAVHEREGLVYLWPDKERKAGRPPLVLRLIRLHDGRREMCLVTNVLDQEQLSDAQAKECYRLRWGLELWFRQLKQTAARRQLASRAPRQATLELAWLMLAMSLLGLLGVQELIRRGRDPRDLSPAGVLGTLRDLAQRPHLRGSLRTLRRSLGPCVKDTYCRKAPKCRVAWPGRKRQHPPGLPHLTDATPAQVAAAARLAGNIAVL